MKKTATIIIIALASLACGRTAHIKGNIGETESPHTIYLELVSPEGRRVVDSAVADKGRFNFKAEVPYAPATFYAIKTGKTVIPLIIKPSQRLRVESKDATARHYTVSGSAESELLHQLTAALSDASAQLDSINALYLAPGIDTAAQKALGEEYINIYLAAKRQQITFIMNNAGSLAALYALYQRLPRDGSLSGNRRTDVIYYGMVADSVGKNFPESPYLASLKADVESMTPKEFVIDPNKISSRPYPEIELADIYGHAVKLSSLEGDVVLVDFWSASSQQCLLNNAELKEVWDELHGRGFSVYQVSVDVSRPLWVDAVLGQRLPWVTVCDFEGGNSLAVKTYNVREVPANYLMDRQGNIVGKNLYGDKLVSRIKELL